MATIALYFLKVMLCSGLLFGYYYAVLRNKRFHQYNRFYLLAAVMLSWLIPLIKIDLSALFRKERPVSYLAYSIATQNTLIEINTKGLQFSWELFFETLFSIVCISFFIVFVWSLLQIRKLLRKHPCKTYKDVVLVLANTAGTPFSFLKFIFWNEEIDIASEAGKQVLEHELTHVREKHSYDKLFMQINHVFGWWNIFFWLMNKELSMIHEFIADKKAIHNGDASALAAMLLKSVYPNHQISITNPFFFSPIKRRLVMISNNSNPKFSYLRRVLILPLFAMVALLFAFRMKENTQHLNEKFLLNENALPLVANAGVDSASSETMKHFSEMLHSIQKEKTLPNGKTAIVIINDQNKLKELFKLYSEMNTSQQARTGVKFYKIPPDVKAVPSETKISKWKDAKMYGLWVDDKRIENKILSNYKAADFSKFFESKLAPNAINYGKHFVQVDLYTNAYFEKTRRRDTSLTLFMAKPITTNADTTIKPTITLKNITKTDNNTNTVAKKDTTIVIDPSVPRMHPKTDMNNVLFVVDGKVMGRGEDANVINSMNPNTISRIDVLKDEQAINKYGDAGKKGVVEITTKKFAEENKPQEVKDLGKNVNESSNQNINNKIFTQVEIPAEFPGGHKEWIKYLEQKLNRDIPVNKGAPPGKYIVNLSFIVNDKGDINNVTALNDPGYGTKEEAVRLMKNCIPWKPAVQNGKNVVAKMEKTITFQVSEE
ncbi:MAG: hypothetical protein J0I09_12980 [Sphingobacteriia bacterium]|nr:hypothetical protein [Sphingobacteriia bacterium]